MFKTYTTDVSELSIQIVELKAQNNLDHLPIFTLNELGLFFFLLIKKPIQ